MKSERLKKIEAELQDLERWLKLGLVPKKDVEKHKAEIEVLRKRVAEEKNRILSIKENGESEEYSVPKRNPQARQNYQEPHTMPGMDAESGLTDAGLDLETESYDTETTTVSGEGNTEDATIVEGEEDDPFSDKNRWRRGILEDPDSDSW